MVNERPKQFGGMPRYAGGPRPGFTQSQPGASQNASPTASRANQLGLGLGKGSAGLGLGKGKGVKRHMKVQRDSIQGVTKGDIRRLARRGGVKRLSASIYDDIRQALRERLRDIMKDVAAVLDHAGRKIVSVTDVIFVLNRVCLSLPKFGMYSC
ncbi:hypothetical protein N0V94_002240 [Neodidymelliopsis sp. IMI 364377]|nr:hypothetical protein N0V94_002240 [Neodidymelliopsis sp. IMI 364377]